MDPQEPLLDDISTGDTTKQTNALTRLLSLSANGKDISIYFNCIVQVCFLAHLPLSLLILSYGIVTLCLTFACTSSCYWYLFVGLFFGVVFHVIVILNLWYIFLLLISIA